MLQGLRTVVYHVVDLAEAKRWYMQVLGQPPYFDEPFYVGFNVGGYELGLNPDLNNTSVDGQSFAYWGVKDVTAAHARLLELGAEPHGDIQDVGDGIKLATLRDPWGNILGIIQNPNLKVATP
ncbi:MAG: VOC family protein [Pseudomonadales bacterium]|nr:VOC family protein [Pseudomonadales bacterium]